ncbi:hypothetical protein SDC9_93559 [bioreactor metagenome]|uniref:Uncharacterized protein n=1 Tax=bioreactor metagenome TaxID=1076179 RepID=A0A645A1D4_9ZZZZ
MVPGVGVQNVQLVDFVEVMLLGVGREHAGDAGVEAAAQQGGNARLLEALPVGPLPAVLKLRRVQRLVVGRVHIVGFGGQAGVHDGEILIGKGQVNHHIGLKALDQGHQLGHAVRVHLGGVNFGLAAVQLGLNGVALGLCAAGNHNFLENIAVLAAFVNGDAGHAAAADNQCLSHGLLPLNFSKILFYAYSTARSLSHT